MQQIHHQIRTLTPRNNQPGIRYAAPTYKQDPAQKYQGLLRTRKGLIKEIRQTRLKGYENRRTYLEEKADIAEITGHTLRLQIIRNIQNVEELRHTYGHICYIVQAANQQNLTKLSYPTKDGWKETTAPQELEEVLLRQQICHFSQPNDTPVICEGSIY